MKDLEKVLTGQFMFNEWKAHEPQPRKFTDTLDEFGVFKIFNSFKEFLEDNPSLLEDHEGNDIDINEVVNNEKHFNEFLESQLNVSSMYDISYQQINEPFLYGEAAAPEARNCFEPISKLKDENDLLMFINEALIDMGTVTHSTGAKNQYEVIGIENTKSS